MEKLNIAAIGLGARGQGVLEGLLLGMNNVNITAVCDTYKDRTERGAETVTRMM